MYMRASLDIVTLDMRSIYLLGVLGLRKYCPELLPLTSISLFLSLFPTSSPKFQLLSLLLTELINLRLSMFTI